MLFDCLVYVAEAKELHPSLCDTMVNTCISTYNIIQTQLLPTPAKSHYTFNLRDLSKVFQGILMANAPDMQVCVCMGIVGVRFVVSLEFGCTLCGIEDSGRSH